MSDVEKGKTKEKTSVPPLLAPTIDHKGVRKWIYPERRKKGKHIDLRRRLSILLMLVYVVVPWIKMQDIPLLRFGIEDQRIYFFGNVLRFNEVNLILFFIVGGAFLLFFVTALWGRLWCGMACPQTVFLDWLIRPIEEWCEGGFAKRKLQDQKKKQGLSFWFRKFCKHFLFALIAWMIANTFLAYFISPDHLLQWVTSSPLEHPRGFSFMLFVWLVFYLDFSWFREQFCSFLCPYARFQSLLIDEKTPVVTFDTKRGDPRGKKTSGDCIDCEFCVRVCPTGIDIRNGLQLECIQCFRCVDACDEVMTNLHRPLGLIKQISQTELERRSPLSWRERLRPRILFYAAGSLCVGSLFIWHLIARPQLNLTLTRPQGALISILPDGRKANMLQARAVNNSSEELSLSLEVLKPDRAELICGVCDTEKLMPFEEKRFVLMVVFDKDAGDGKLLLKHKLYQSLAWEISTL